MLSKYGPSIRCHWSFKIFHAARPQCRECRTQHSVSAILINKWLLFFSKYAEEVLRVHFELQPSSLSPDELYAKGLLRLPYIIEIICLPLNITSSRLLISPSARSLVWSLSESQHYTLYSKAFAVESTIPTQR